MDMLKVLQYMVLISAMSFHNIHFCNGYLCLTWSAVNDKIILRCKTDSLDFPVSFYSPTGEEVAFCNIPLPQPQCDSLMPNISVEQEIQTHTTILTYSGNIDSRVNGEWQCKHGINLEGGTVNVTVIKVKDILTGKEECDHLTKKEENGTYSKLFSSTMFCFIITMEILWILRVFKGLLLSESCKRNLSGIQSTKFKFVVMIAITSSLGALVGIPRLVSTIWTINVVAHVLLGISGSVIAILVSVLTDMYNYAQIGDKKWMKNDSKKGQHSTKEFEMQMIDN